MAIRPGAFLKGETDNGFEERPQRGSPEMHISSGEASNQAAFCAFYLGKIDKT